MRYIVKDKKGKMIFQSDDIAHIKMHGVLEYFKAYSICPKCKEKIYNWCGAEVLDGVLVCHNCESKEGEGVPLVFYGQPYYFERK